MLNSHKDACFGSHELTKAKLNVFEHGKNYTGAIFQPVVLFSFDACHAVACESEKTEIFCTTGGDDEGLCYKCQRAGGASASG